ncbi:MAG TPA: HEAT repeat domain-containing protein [Planctomycetota bacterium]|nr:HEAT repeat domain-containing protein [Planctomycetota bacterium]
MPSDLERLSGMLESGDAELQCAVARVLRELKPEGPEVRKALARTLKSGNDAVRLYAVEALAAIDPEGSLRNFVPLLSAGEPLRGRVHQILTSAGRAAVEALQEQLDAKDPQVRKGVLEILGRLKDVDTTEALFAGLLDPDLEVIRKAAQAYRQRIESMSGSDRSKALKKILEFLGSSKVQKARTPIASCLLIVGALRDPSAAPTLLRYLDRKMPPAARNHALLALGGLSLEGATAKTAAAKLLPLLGEPDFNEIVKPALDVLHKIPLGKAETDRVIRLLESAHPGVRLYALRALGSIGTPAAAAPLLEALWGADPRAAESAASALASNPDFVPSLLKALDRQGDVQKQWKIVNILRTYKNVLDRGTIRTFVAKGLTMLDRKQSGFQAFFEIVRAAAPDVLRETLLKKGRDLLAKGKAEDAERHLRVLERDDLATPDSDFALATAQLRGQRLDLAGAGRDRGPALYLFSKLSRREGFPLLKKLEKDAGLVTAQGLLYLGFALVERQGDERTAGAEILKLVAKRFASKEEGKVAKRKLKTQGAG